MAEWAVEALRYYLLGNPFQLITDHGPLLWLTSIKATNTRIMRWYLFLQPYGFQVLHHPGKAHILTKVFSRPGGGEQKERPPPGPSLPSAVVQRTPLRVPELQEQLGIVPANSAQSKQHALTHRPIKHHRAKTYI